MRGQTQERNAKEGECHVRPPRLCMKAKVSSKNEASTRHMIITRRLTQTSHSQLSHVFFVVLCVLCMQWHEALYHLGPLVPAVMDGVSHVFPRCYRSTNTTPLPDIQSHVNTKFCEPPPLLRASKMRKNCTMTQQKIRGVSGSFSDSWKFCSWCVWGPFLPGSCWLGRAQILSGSGHNWVIAYGCFYQQTK